MSNTGLSRSRQKAAFDTHDFVWYNIYPMKKFLISLLFLVIPVTAFADFRTLQVENAKITFFDTPCSLGLVIQATDPKYRKLLKDGKVEFTKEDGRPSRKLCYIEDDTYVYSLDEDYIVSVFSRENLSPKQKSI